MLDAALRSLKDRPFAALSRAVPPSVAPLHITGLGFLCGLAACGLAATNRVPASIFLWVLNRALDCLDGAVARSRGQQSDLGGFLDLLADFVVYSLIPISCSLGQRAHQPPAPAADMWSDLLAIALLEASFHINNFVLFFAGTVSEKEKHNGTTKRAGELTSIALRPALIEGFESSAFFTLMLLAPDRICQLSYLMLAGVLVGTTQRVFWLVSALSQPGLKALVQE